MLMQCGWLKSSTSPFQWLGSFLYSFSKDCLIAVKKSGEYVYPSDREPKPISMKRMPSLACRIAGCFLLFFFQQASAQSSNALSFDGTDDYVSTPAYVVPTSGDFTVELWVYATTYTGYREFVSQGTTGNAFYIGTTNSSGVIRCGDTWIATGVTMPLNRWVHLALVKSGSSATLYVDGVQKASLASGYSISTAGTPFQMGAQYGGNGEFHNGKLDEIRVWNVARTATQIKAGLYNTNLSVSTSGLVAYYKLDEGSGSTAANSCTNTTGINGTLNNGPLWTASPIQLAANALQFNGTSNYVELSNRINIGSSDFTIEAWVYPQSTSAGMVFAQDVCGDAEHQFRLYTTNSKISFDLSDASALGAPYSFQLASTAGAVPLNTWTHVAVTRSGNNYSLYINGVSNATYSTGANTINNQSGADANKRLRIGARGGVSGGCGLNYFNGKIDELRLWSVARTATEISDNYNRELDPVAHANLQAYYTFNQGLASGSNSGVTTIIDLKGNNNGTLNGFSLSGSSSNFVSQNSTMVILPLQWLSFTAEKQNGRVLLQWQTTGETGTASFEIEHSTDGRHWQTTGSVAAAGTAAQTHSYRFEHASPASGSNYYRLREEDRNGRIYYSETRVVRMEEGRSFQVLSNPSGDKTLRLSITSAKLALTMVSSEGKWIWTKELRAGTHFIDLSSLPKGLYILSTGEKGGGSEKLLLR
jgi:hypothetical protein